MPWYALVCGIAAAVPFRATADQQVWTLGWWGSTLLFAALTLALRRPLWLFPTFGFGIVAYLATGFLLDPALSTARSFATLAVPAWAFLGLAWMIDRRRQATAAPGSPLPRTGEGPRVGAPARVGDGSAARTGEGPADTSPSETSDDPVRARLLEAARRGRGSLHRWSVPLQVAGWLTLVLACLGSLTSARDGLAATLALGVLQVVLAMLRVKPGYAWVGLGVLALAFQHGLRVAEVAGHLQPVWWAGASLVTVLLSLRPPAEGSLRAALWRPPTRQRQRHERRQAHRQHEGDQHQRLGIDQQRDLPQHDRGSRASRERDRAGQAQRSRWAPGPAQPPDQQAQRQVDQPHEQDDAHRRQ
jgi:hypothetical protein